MFCASTISSGSWSACFSNVSHGRNGNNDGGHREPHWPAVNEHRHRAHCQDGHSAAHANLDGPAADDDMKHDNPGASSVERADRHESVGKPGKLDASVKGGWNDWDPVMLSYTRQLEVGQVPDERHEELSSVGNSSQ